MIIQLSIRVEAGLVYKEQKSNLFEMARINLKDGFRHEFWKRRSLLYNRLILGPYEQGKLF